MKDKIGPCRGAQEYAEWIICGVKQGDGLSTTLCIIAVSYTHLDVYKRQNISCLIIYYSLDNLNIIKSFNFIFKSFLYNILN